MSENLRRRVLTIPRIFRKMAKDAYLIVNTVEEQECAVPFVKTCSICIHKKSILNFYVRSGRQEIADEDLTLKDFESCCITCWDERISQRKTTIFATLVSFFNG